MADTNLHIIPEDREREKDWGVFNELPEILHNAACLGVFFRKEGQAPLPATLRAL